MSKHDQAPPKEVQEEVAPLPYKIVDGVRVYGDRCGEVSVAEVESIQATSRSEFHLARHYSSLPEEYIGALVGQEFEYFDYRKQAYKKKTITSEDVEAAFGTQGSKFFPDMPGLETPARLIEFIKAEAAQKAAAGGLEWFTSKGPYKKAIFTIECDQDVGTLGVVKLSDLKGEQKDKVERQPRGKLAGEEFMVNVVKDMEPPTTGKIVVEIRSYDRDEGAVEVATAYSGIVAPSFPRDEQDEEQREYCERFWSEHAFVT